MNEAKHVYSPLDHISLRILEPVTLIYLTVCIVCYSLYTIPAFPRFLSSINLNNVVRPLLRNIGVILCAVEGICSFRMRKGPGRLLLYGMIAAATFSSWQQRVYGTASNINSILWMAIIFILGYSAVYHFGSQVMRWFATISYIIFMTVWCTACCLSLVQFALRISNVGPNYATSPWLQGKGFVAPRLTGIFGYPEYGASFGLLLMIVGLYLTIKTRWWILRIIIVLFNLPLFFYLVLSITRNAILAMYLAVFIGAFLFFLKNVRKGTRKGVLVSLGLACAVLFTLFCAQTATKKIAEHIPEHFDKAKQATEAPTASVPSSPAKKSSIPVSALRGGTAGRKPPAATTLRNNPEDKISVASTVPAIQKPTTAANGLPAPATPPSQADAPPGLLNRKYNNNDLTSGRLQIWKDYLSISEEIGLFGLSPENASWYIQEHYPSLFICSHIREAHPDLYKNGYVYHPHSGYLKVFVSSGFIGLACVLVFFLRCAITVVSHVRKSRHLSAEFICSLMVVVAGMSSALFEPELFFNLTNPIMFFFWIAVSVLMRSMAQTGKARTGKLRRQQAGH